MKILGGSAKGTTLFSVNDNSVRPALARMRNSLFNILGPGIGGLKCLDLFAGTGALGLEALSRGAEFSIFVENNRRCYDVIRQNIDKLRFNDRAQILFMDAFNILAHPTGPGKMDIIFVDPPYKYYTDGRIRMKLFKLLDDMAGTGMLAAGGRVIVEHQLKEFNGAEFERLKLYDTREYGQTVLSFLRVEQND
jgi:16S rRNA (guanine(966)-N(2))-methyltransferase RsmD